MFLQKCEKQISQRGDYYNFYVCIFIAANVKISDSLMLCLCVIKCFINEKIAGIKDKQLWQTYDKHCWIVCQKLH